MYKFMLTTHEVTSRSANMFKQTIFRASDASSKKLIPIKQNKPVEEYGGYSSNVDAYMAIVRIKQDKKDDQYKVVGVKRRWVDELMNVSDSDYLQVLHDKLAPSMIMRGKNLEFEVVIGKVPYRQAIIDGDSSFTLGSSAYKYNNKQLVLSRKSVETLDINYVKSLKLSDADLSKRYDDVYLEIVQKVNDYLPLYDINNSREQLSTGFDKFKLLPNEDLYEKMKKKQSGKLNILQEILNGLHDNPMMGSLKELNIKTSFGQLQIKNGVPVSPDAIIHYQSPTGLFERKVRLKDL